MRVIGTLNDEKKALDFSFFLHQKGIGHQLEAQPNTDWGSLDYGISVFRIWIYEEDQVEEALKGYQLFLEHPQDPAFELIQKPLVNPTSPSFSPTPLPFVQAAASLPSESTITPLTSAEIAWEKQPMGWMTRFFLILCSLLFLANSFIQSPNSATDSSSSLLFTSPIDKVLLYDYPHFYELISQFIQVYGYEKLETPQTLPLTGQQLFKEVNQTPVWLGVYSVISKKGLKSLLEGNFPAPLFEKIRQGEVWRLFTPALLHTDIFHLFFNMLWLIVLGKQIEQRIKPLRYLAFILIVGLFSNTAQYLMSGPNFVGFSGVLCGMLTFVWIRQVKAPWEGYQLDRLTLIFMLVYIFGMALVQLLSFFIEQTFSLSLSPNIANMAHLMGALAGYLLARLNFFSWRQA